PFLVWCDGVGPCDLGGRDGTGRRSRETRRRPRRAFARQPLEEFLPLYPRDQVRPRLLLQGKRPQALVLPLLVQALRLLLLPLPQHALLVLLVRAGHLLLPGVLCHRVRAD